MSGTTDPTVSVVIPLYNAEDVIRATVQTVLDQTWKDYEIVVVDDGSTDASGRIVQGMTERLRYVRQNNAGVAKARNRGIAESRGRYIALLDHDDLWDPSKLEKQVAVLESMPAVGMVITEVGHLDRTGRPTGAVAKAYDASDPFYGLFVKGYAPTPSAAMIRKSVLEAVGGFDESFSSAGMDDHELWPRIADVTDIASIPETLTYHRNRWEKPSEIGLGHRAILIEKLRERVGQDPKKNRYLHREEVRYWADLGKRLLQEGRCEEGRALLLRGLIRSLTVAHSPKIAWRCLCRLGRSYV